jgi:outer membrane protein OmpA-like peptidoglycan-associated protein/LysM repeat protein
MHFKKYLSFIVLSAFSFLVACNDPKKSESQQNEAAALITNNDIEQAKELFIPTLVTDTTWLIDSSNTGFGQRQDFNADSAFVKNTYQAEINTDWYRFVAPKDTSLAITVEPNDPTAEYDMIVFKSTGDSIKSDLAKGLIPAIRSNFSKISKPEDTITGFKCDYRLFDHNSSDSINQFSEAFWMQKGETYYLVLNTTSPKGAGYKLRMHSCAPGEGVRKGSSDITRNQNSQTGPVITSFSPLKARKGKTITITGKHFTDANSVAFGGIEASSFQVISDEKILAIVGKGASGNVVVVTPSGTAEKESFVWQNNTKQGKKSKGTVKTKSKSKSKSKSKRKKPAEAEEDGEFYIVKAKDTMFSIAFIFGMSVEEILKLNNLENTNVFVGQKLKVIRRQLPQKAIDKKVSKSKKVKPSPPVAGSTTHPQVIARAKIDDQKKKPTTVAPSSGTTTGNTPVKTSAAPVESRNTAFNPTPNYPNNNPVVKSGVETKNSLAPADKSFYVYCNVTSGVNKQPVAGTLQIVDLKKKDLVYNVQANRTQSVPLFNSGGKQKLFICDIFGYKKQDFDLNLDNIINDSTAQQVQIADDTIVINFELKRIEKGDVAVAYNIFFYDDASVMLPKSTYELDQLLELMVENNKIKIKIHGHTNTSKLGKILYLEKGDKTFFRLTAKNKETYGPARMLSKKRAETIKWYLESKRITDDRIQVEGHGGSQMLYPNTHPLAFKNKRVEVEILEDK